MRSDEEEKRRRLVRHRSTQQQQQPSEACSGQRRQVLSEEDYTATLTSIVRRDFYPDLPDLERQAALLDRRAAGDIPGAVAVRRAARALAGHEESLAEQEAEDEQDLTESNVRKKARPLHRETLTGFHARATNEDDEEFDSLQRKEVQENRERLEHLFRPEEAPKKKLLLTMASDEFQPTSNQVESSEWKKPSVRNSMFFSPAPQRLPETESSTATPKQALLSNNPHSVEHSKRSQQSHSQTGSETDQSEALSLMPPPAARKGAAGSSQLSQKGSKSQSSLVPYERSLPKGALVEYIPKTAVERKIDPSQTRFPPKAVVPYRPPLFPAGRGSMTSDSESGFTTDASTDLDACDRSITDERRARSKREVRDRNSYVNMTPLVMPGSGGDDDEPIMTWGEVSDTPLILSGQEMMDSSSSGKNDSITANSTAEFSLPEESASDKAAQRAQANLERRSKRARAASSVKRKRPDSIRNISGMRQQSSLTPAAMALMKRTQGSSSRARDAFASSLRSSYTPLIKRGSSVTTAANSAGATGRDHAHKATPLASRKG